LETFTRLDQWLAFFDGINSYPLTYKWESQRLAVNEGLTNGHPLLDPRERRKRRASLSQNQATTPKRTCIFSDVHANLYALESVLKEAKQLEVDSYLFLGDAVGYGPHPSECLERLMNLPNLQAIRGNHDQMVAEGQVDEDCNRLARASIEWSYQRLSSVQREWLLNLPLEVQNGSQDDELMWLAVHGAPIDRHRIYAYVYEMTYRNNLQHIEEQGVPLCFYGHTHVPFIYRRTLKTENGQPTPTDEKISPGPIQEPNNKQFMLFNPGSVGQPRDRDPRASFAIWDRREKLLSFQRIAYPIEKSVAALHKTELPEDLAIRLEMGW
jgi:predicted phosphodiesterase